MFWWIAAATAAWVLYWVLFSRGLRYIRNTAVPRPVIENADPVAECRRLHKRLNQSEASLKRLIVERDEGRAVIVDLDSALARLKAEVAFLTRARDSLIDENEELRARLSCDGGGR